LVLKRSEKRDDELLQEGLPKKFGDASLHPRKFSFNLAEECYFFFFAFAFGLALAFAFAFGAALALAFGLALAFAFGFAAAFFTGILFSSQTS